MTPRALLAADCGRGVGLGHLERMIALADALQPDVAVDVLLPEGDAALHRRVVDRGHRPVAVAGPTPERVERAVATTLPFDAVVLDGYVFNVPLQHRLRARAPLTVVDDLRLPADCDLAVNPSPGGDLLRPDGADAFLGGAGYALVRASFLDARELALRGATNARTVLISTGATDLDGLGPRVSAALLASDPTVHVVRVVGPDAPETAMAADPREQLLVAPPTIAETLAGATIYVGAAGTTAVQAACVGIPSVITAAVRNQDAQAAALAAAGCALVTTADGMAAACLALLDDAKRCEEMAQRGRELVDGHGATRVADAVRHLAAARARS